MTRLFNKIITFWFIILFISAIYLTWGFYTLYFYIFITSMTKVTSLTFGHWPDDLLRHSSRPDEPQTNLTSNPTSVSSWARTGSYWWSGGSGSESCSGSLVLGITPMMVLFREVPFSSRWPTSCMFRGESTLNRTVEPGRSTPSWVSSSGRRFGIWIPPAEAISEQLDRKTGLCLQHRVLNCRHFRVRTFETKCFDNLKLCENSTVRPARRDIMLRNEKLQHLVLSFLPVPSYTIYFYGKGTLFKNHLK